MVRQNQSAPTDVPLETASAPGTLTRRFVSWTLRYGKLLWAIALLLAIPATVRTVSLYRHLRSEIEELLPRSAPSVVAIDELRHRMAGLQYLGVLVDVGSPDAWPPASASSTTWPSGSAAIRTRRSATSAPASPPSARSSNSTAPLSSIWRT